MFTIAFKGFGSYTRGKTLWQIACLSLVWFVWQERNARIFYDKERTEGDASCVRLISHLFLFVGIMCPCI